MPAPNGHPAYNVNGEGGRHPNYTKEDIEKYAENFNNWLKVPTNVWFKDFCLDNDLDPDLLSEWANQNERFRGVYKIAKHRQESRLVNGGLLSIYNGGIVKLVLANAHGWTDKSQQSITVESKGSIMGELKDTGDLVHE